MRRSWRVTHPTGTAVLSGHGHGGPAPAPGPQTGQPPRVPGGTQLPTPGDLVNQAVNAITAPLSGVLNKTTTDIVSGGQVLLGVLLVGVGLLLATGLWAPAARAAKSAGLFAVTKGAVR